MKSTTLAVLLGLSLFSGGCTHASLPSGASPLPPPAASPSTAAVVSASGSPDAKGWQRFTARDGAWSVEVPGKLEEDPNSIQIHRFATKYVENKPVYELAILDISDADKTKDRAALVHSFVEGLVKSSPKVNKRAQSRLQHVYPAERVVYEGPHGRRMLAQVFATQNYVWSMQIVAPATVKDLHELDVPRFMDSIQVKDAPARENAPGLPSSAP